MIVRKAVFSRFLRRLSHPDRSRTPERGTLDSQRLDGPRDVQRDFREGRVILEEETPEEAGERAGYIRHEAD